jgi:hypothetical protein
MTDIIISENIDLSSLITLRVCVCHTHTQTQNTIPSFVKIRPAAKLRLPTTTYSNHIGGVTNTDRKREGFLLDTPRDFGIPEV